MKMDKNLLRYLGGAVFVILAISSFSDFDWDIINIFILLGYVLISIGFFAERQMVCAVGYGILALVYFFNVIHFMTYFGSRASFEPVFNAVITIGGFALLLLCALDLPAKKTIAFVSAGLFILRAFLYIGKPVVWVIISSLMIAVIAILYGLCAKSNTIKTAERKTIPHYQKPGEQILRLKDLLDKGIITEEEYNLKKTELLQRL